MTTSPRRSGARGCVIGSRSADRLDVEATGAAAELVLLTFDGAAH